MNLAVAIQSSNLDGLLRYLQASATAHAGTPPAVVKRQVLQLIRRHGGGRPWALELAATADPGAQEIAAILLGEGWAAGGEGALLERLAVLADSDHWEVREWAASGAGIALAGRPSAFLPTARAWVSSPSPNRRRAASLAVMYGSKSLGEEWVPALLETLGPLLADEDPYVRKNLGPFVIGDALLPRFPGPVLAWLGVQTRDEREAVRINIALVWRAAAALRWSSEGRAILLGLASDQRPAVRRAVSGSLRRV